LVFAYGDCTVAVVSQRLKGITGSNVALLSEGHARAGDYSLHFFHYPSLGSASFDRTDIVCSWPEHADLAQKLLKRLAYAWDNRRGNLFLSRDAILSFYIESVGPQNKSCGNIGQSGVHTQESAGALNAPFQNYNYIRRCE